MQLGNGEALRYQGEAWAEVA